MDNRGEYDTLSELFKDDLGDKGGNEDMDNRGEYDTLSELFKEDTLLELGDKGGNEDIDNSDN